MLGIRRLADDGKRLELSEFALDVSFKCRRQQYLRNLSISLLGGESEGGRIMADWVPSETGGFLSKGLNHSVFEVFRCLGLSRSVLRL